MIGWFKRQLVKPEAALDEVNPKTLELKVAKKMLSELFDVGVFEVDEMIQRRIEYRELYGQEFDLESL